MAVLIQAGQPPGRQTKEVQMAGSIICGVDDSESAKGAARVARGLSSKLGGVPPVGWTPERLVGTVRSGGKDAPPCQGDRTFISRTRRSSGVKLLSWSAGRAGR